MEGPEVEIAVCMDCAQIAEMPLTMIEADARAMRRVGVTPYVETRRGRTRVVIGCPDCEQWLQRESKEMVPC